MKTTKLVMLAAILMLVVVPAWADWGQAESPDFTLDTTIPEPAALLAGLGVILIGWRLRARKMTCAALAVLLLAATAARIHAATPVVTNVTAQQQAGSSLVDIHYDVFDADGDTQTISAALSLDSGAAYHEVDFFNYWGDTGAGILTGTQKHITWDAGLDLPMLSSDTVRVQITADDFVSPYTAEYLVIDVSGGPDATNYPVSQLSSPPVLTGEESFTKIILQRIPMETNMERFSKMNNPLPPVPPNGFTIGSPVGEVGRNYDANSQYSDENQKKVSISLFYMAQTETKQGTYELVMGPGSNRSSFKGPNWEDRPVEMVSWDTVRGGIWPGGDPAVGSFMDKIRRKTSAPDMPAGQPYDLPTEAQWEYACRATTTKALNSDQNLNYEKYDGNMDLVGQYWYNGGEYSKHVAVPGPYPLEENSWRLQDMHGNVWEWCLDWYRPYYVSEPDPQGPTRPRVPFRVIRGGGWDNSAFACRSAARRAYLPSLKNYSCGFRIAWTATSIRIPTNYVISGTVSGVLNGRVPIRLSGWTSGGNSVYVNTMTATDDVGLGNGKYKFTGLRNGTYTVTPMWSGYMFSPGVSAPILISGADMPNINFTVSQQAEYCVVDISAGPNAASYPVTHLYDTPGLGGASEYRTTKILLRVIPAGSFLMGSPATELGRNADEPQHWVTLTHTSCVGVFEITQAQYSNVMGTCPSLYPGPLTRPVEQLSWTTIRGGTWRNTATDPGEPDSGSFIGKLRTKTQLAFDLPTEAQWEYACRAGTTKALNNNVNLVNPAYDPNMDILGRYKYNNTSGDPMEMDNAGSQHTVVGSYLPNQWGLYDMHGNVWEWCLDWYSNRYSGTVTDPPGPLMPPLSADRRRVARSGNWYSDTDNSWNCGAKDCRSATRIGAWPSKAFNGFRLFLMNCLTNNNDCTNSCISGRVTGAVQDGVTITITPPGVTTLTYGGGYYWKCDIPLGIHTVTPSYPSNPGYTFTPPFRIVTNDCVNVTNVNFVVSTNTYATNDWVTIPSNGFLMGNCMTNTEGVTDELPLHWVTLGAFRMDKYEVTLQKWQEVYTWALASGLGYTFDNPGLGKAANHPVHTVNWYDMVKWCNARSEKEGKTPCYYLDAAQTIIYKSGANSNVWNAAVKWSANGYRLPTEAEWEKAARGGTAGHRFPWSDVEWVDFTRANYWSYWTGGVPYFSYDHATTEGYYPTFATGGTPYTSPVAHFAANGYGFYDMAGNLVERCWDWYDATYYSSSPANDPRGPASSPYSSRVLRGGSWINHAEVCRVACRGSQGAAPGYSSNFIGFRCVRGL